MIITWFTQPPSPAPSLSEPDPEKSLSSYYQYETVTQRFTRIRLELGRDSKSGKINDTLISFKKQRAVGFSKDRLSFDPDDPGDSWSVEKGVLLHEGTPLRGTPQPGDRVYDTSDPDSFVHSGNKVTSQPELLPGIEPHHLALLANDAMITQPRKTISLTGPGVTREQLAKAVKGEVCRVLDVPDFGSITDDMILGKLTSQAKVIGGVAAGESSSSLEKALTTAEDEIRLISEQLGEGVLTPTPEFESAFESVGSAVTVAQQASGAADMERALAATGEAEQALSTAIESIDTAKNEAAARQLELTGEALAQAKQQAIERQAEEDEYRALDEASTVEEYDREIGITSEEEVV